MLTNAAISSRAKQALKGNWGLAIGSFIFYSLVSICFSTVMQLLIRISVAESAVPFLSPLVSPLFTGPLSVGICGLYLSIARNQEPSLGQLFVGFKRYFRSVVALLAFTLIAGLGMLLFIVPGIVFALQYCQVFFILNDDDQISARGALSKSYQLMDGNKMQLFNLFLRYAWPFFFMIIPVTVLLFGIELHIPIVTTPLFIVLVVLDMLLLLAYSFYITPLMYTAMGVFYEAAKATQNPNEGIDTGFAEAVVE